MSDHQHAEEGAEYEVGYCKPPKHSQFKKGNKSGKGRKKSSKGIKTIVNEVYGEKMTASFGGKTKKIPAIEATIRQVAKRGLQGDPKAGEKGIALYERYGPQDDESGPAPEKLERDMAALRHYLAMQDRLGNPSAEEEPRNG